MKVLGVNAGQASLWLCVVGDEGPEDTDPSSLTLFDGPVGGHALLRLIAATRWCHQWSFLATPR